MADPIVSLKQVSKVYRTDKIETLALSNINLDVARGEFLSIMGPSGCGKSTLLNVLGMLDSPTDGQMMFSGRPVGSLKDDELAPLRNRELGFVFQTFHLIPDLRVVDNVELPLLYRKLSGKSRRELAEEALETVGLSSRTEHFPTQLSGGQQQRVAIARAVVGNPSLLLADEPTGNLDSHMGDEVMELLQGLNQSGTTIVMVTHDQRKAEATERIIRIFDGQVVI